MKALIEGFRCYRKDPMDASNFSDASGPVTAVRFRSGEGSLHLHLLGADADKFEIGAKYTLTLEPSKSNTSERV